MTTRPDGSVHGTAHSATQGVSATGLSTGNTYRFIQVRGNIQPFETENLPFILTITETTRVVEPSPGNDLVMHVTSHVTINANGEASVFVSNISTECK